MAAVAVAVSQRDSDGDGTPTLSVATSDSLNVTPHQSLPLPLVCGLCGHDYSQPKLLPCFHTHCASCLESVAPSNSLSIHCPKCLLQFILPAGGVASLMDNTLFHQYAVQENNENDLMSKLSRATRKQEEVVASCLTHTDFLLTFYCRNCDKLLCEACTKSSPECMAHKIDTVRDVAKAQRLLLLDLLRRTDSSFPTLLTARTKAKAAVSSLRQKYAAIRDEIQRVFKDLHTLLSKREHLLASILESKFAEKRKALESQEHELSRAIEAYNKTRRFLDSVVLKGSDVDVIIVKKEMSEFYSTLSSRNMASTKANDAMKLNAKLDELRREIEQFGSIEINNAVAMETCAEGVGIKSAQVQEDTTFRLVLKDAAGEIVRLPLEDGELMVEVKSPFNDLLPARVLYDDKDNAKAGTYTVTYRTEYPGLYEISVKLRGEPIKDSPFSVRSSRRELAVGANGAGQFPAFPAPIGGNRKDDRASSRSGSRRTQSPASVASSGRSNSNSFSTDRSTSTLPSPLSVALLEKATNGNLLTRSRTTLGSSRSTVYSVSQHSTVSRATNKSVASLHNKRLPTPLIATNRSVNKSLAKISSSVETESTGSNGAYAAIRFGYRGTNVGQFVSPQGVAFSAALNALIVADSNNHNVQLFDCRNSKYMRQFGERGRNEGQLLKPTGVASCHRGGVLNFLVTDFESKCINVFEADGKFKERFGEMKVLGPKGIAVDHEGRVLVADHRAGCVCVFSANTKKLIQRIGGRGNAEHQFGAPYYVAVNSNNDMIVTDFQHRKVKVFSAEGRFLFSFSMPSGPNSSNQAVGGPTGVAVDEKGRIIVADWASATVQVFDNNGCFLQYVNTVADPLNGPQGLTVTSTYGAVAVADNGNHCVKIYRY